MSEDKKEDPMEEKLRQAQEESVVANEKLATLVREHEDLKVHANAEERKKKSLVEELGMEVQKVEKLETENTGLRQDIQDRKQEVEERYKPLLRDAADALEEFGDHRERCEIETRGSCTCNFEEKKRDFKTAGQVE